jgi:N-acetylmuramoyl-L-alanine amidase
VQKRNTSINTHFFVVLLTLFFCLSRWGDQQILARPTNSHVAPTKPGKKRIAVKVHRRSTTRVSAVNRKATKGKALAKENRKVVSSSTVALFGPRYARVAVKDHLLRGAVYYLASGHGGPDPGALGRYGKYVLPEDEYAYDVTIRLARALMEHGATVYMILQDPNDGIRDDKILKLDRDEVTYPRQSIPLNQTLRLRQCTDAVNRLNRKHKGAYQRMVTIHVDSRSAGETIDVFFYHHQNSGVGKRLAKNIHRSFNAGYKRYQPNRSYLGNVSDRSSLYVVRNSHPPTVFIELGNIRNEKDQRRFLLAGNRQALANWICDGMRVDYKLR